MTVLHLIAPFKKLRVKVALFVLLLLLSVTSGLYVVVERLMNDHIVGEVIKRGESLGRGVASAAGYSITSRDLLGLDNLVYQIKSSNPDIDYIAITGKEGSVLVHNEISKAGEAFRPAAGRLVRRSGDGAEIVDVVRGDGGRFEIRCPIRFMDRPLGAVVLGVNKTVPQAAQREARKKMLVVFGSVLVLGVATSLLVSSFLTRPILALSAGVTELKAGTLREPLRVTSRDELGHLTQSFNEMTALITAQRDRLSRYAQDLEEAYVSTVSVLAAAIDARDAYTLGHSTRVARLSVRLGRDLGLERGEIEDLEVACLFHDVGKIKIPDAILLKKGRLSPDEQREMRRHTEYGAEILSKASSLLKYMPAVRHHHEWFDGSGYPDGLAGAGIPRSAAVIALADSYDAMTSDRPYRGALSELEARGEIRRLAARQFEPDLAARFIRLLESAPEDERREAP